MFCPITACPSVSEGLGSFANGTNDAHVLGWAFEASLAIERPVAVVVVTGIYAES